MDDPIPRHGTAHRYDDAKSEWRSLHLAVDLWVINGGDDDCGHTLRRFCAQYMETHLAVGGDLCLAVAAVATTLTLQHTWGCAAVNVAALPYVCAFCRGVCLRQWVYWLLFAGSGLNAVSFQQLLLLLFTPCFFLDIFA